MFSKGFTRYRDTTDFFTHSGRSAGDAALVGAARLMHCGARDVSHTLIDNTYQLRRYDGHASLTP